MCNNSADFITEQHLKELAHALADRIDQDAVEHATAYANGYLQGRRDERELCAKMAESWKIVGPSPEFGGYRKGFSDAGDEIATAIRKRGSRIWVDETDKGHG
jgi:hypothetical protein